MAEPSGPAAAGGDEAAAPACGPAAAESPPRRRGARRRRVPGGRQHNEQVRFSDAEYEAVLARAAAAGLSVSAYLAAAAEPRGRLGVAYMPVEERRAWASELMAVRRLLAAVGSNVNQLARTANSGGTVSRGQAQATLAACERAAGRVGEVLDQLQGGRS